MTYKEYIEQLGIGSLNTIPKNSLSPIWRNNITRLNEQNFAALYSSLNNNFLNTINPVIDAVNGLARVVIGTAGQKYKFTYNNVTGKWEYELADSDSTCEIFNAYPPLQEEGKDIFNVAIAEFTSSSGKNTQSGSKAFLITACNQQEKTFTLDSVEGLEVGDVYSISASGYADVEDIAEIVEINGNVVKVEHLPVEDGVGYGNAVPKSDALPEDFPQGLSAPYFRIIAKPNIGTQTIGEAASSFGKETIAEMNASFVTGRGSKSVGKYGVAIGDKNTAYYAAAAIGGGNNKAFGKNSAIIGGSSNKANGYSDFVGGGQNNETSGACAFATGSWNKVPGFNAAAFGLYNESHGQNDFVTGYKNIVNGYCASAFGLFHNIKGNGNFATGKGSTAKEGAENCFITGQSNLAENAAGCILAGSDNAVVGESVENKILQGVMLGRNNKVTGHYGVAAGYSNVANTQSVALGLNNVADVWRAFALGTGLKAKYMDQVVVGSFNTINGNAAFIVGNGTSDTARSNAFVVNKDGSAEVAKQGTKDLSVATIKDLNEKVSSVYRYKGSVANKEALPTTGNVIGDVYNAEDSGMNYGWNGTTWDTLGSEVDQSYQSTSIKAQSGKAVAEAINSKQDTLVSGTNIKTVNNQSILGSGNIEISEITVDDALSDTSTNPVQNKVIKSALDSKLEVKVLNYTSTTLITREQLAALEPGIYDIKYDKNNSDAPCYGCGVNVQINSSFNEETQTYITSTIGFSGREGVARVKVEYIWIYERVIAGKRITAEGILGEDPVDFIGTFVDMIPSGSTLLQYPDKVDGFVRKSESSNYINVFEQTKDSTAATVQLRDYNNQNRVIKFTNTLTSLSIALPTAATPMGLSYTERLIFKATSSTTITVPSGLYFRGDDCNDSYVFIPQDNKVYDIIITYDGFNYNGIVVGTPATR